MDYLYLILGFILLIISGNFLVKGGVQVAAHFKIPTLIVGLTIVSIGTSAPELFVSTGAALQGSPDMSIGNVVGSNIANIGLILGITTLILPMPIARDTLRINFPVMLFISLLLWALSLNLTLNREEGILFVALLILYIIFLIIRSKKAKKDVEEAEKPTTSLAAAFLYIVVASFGLYYGAELLVSSARNIALDFGVSERVIGLTIVAFGTSVPELATSIIAALKREMDISVGNIIGSNIFNILCVLGITSIITPIRISPAVLDFDIYFMVGITLLLFLTMFPLSNPKVKRWGGALLLALYITYIALLFLK